MADQLIAQLRTAEIRIPPYPAIVSSLDRLGRDPRMTLGQVTAVVATDATLAATVLRYVATAAMKAGGAISLEAAIRTLGLDELVRVVIATTVGAVASAPGPLALLRRDQWRRSLLASMFCKELASRRGVAPDQAFLAGLLHDFGAIVLLTRLEAMGAQVLPVLPQATWRRVVEQHHIELGMLVVARWQLPEALAEVVEHHHAPQSSGRIYRPLVQLVAIVDQIIEILDRSASGGIAALSEVPGLEHDERCRIGALMPKVAIQMAQFETPAERAPTSRIEEPAERLEGGWPVELVLEDRNHAQLRACTLAPNALAFRSPIMRQPAWLAELTLHCPPDVITMLAYVKSCRATPGGDFLVTAQPFGLAGDDERAWSRLITRTQPIDPSHP